MPTTPPDANIITRLEKGPSDQSNGPQVAMTLWSLYLEEANERAKAKAELWNGSIGAFLLFAGLFAGVVASFVIDSRAGLQPDPKGPVPATTVAINFLWFLSLTFTLLSALAAVLAQTWVVKFSLAPTKGFEAARERWIHDDKAEKWHLHTAIAWITVLIQLALFLFLAGFAVQALVDNRDIGWTILSLVAATLVLYIVITILPWLSPTAPFRTPFSDLNTRNQSIYLSDSSTSSRPAAAAKGAKDRTLYAWKSFRSSWRDLIETPTPSHVRLGICSSLLRNSSKNGSIHAAVAELTRNVLTQENCERLVQFGLPDDLCIRVTELVHSPNNSARVERMNSYLRAIIWMVNGSVPRVDVTEVAQGFYPLLHPGGALLALDMLPPECRALAFGVRVHLLLSGCDSAEILATDWNTLVGSLEQASALSVFRAAIRGLERGEYGLPQDCARMLAVYIGSARFSNETLAVAQPDYVRPKMQPEPVQVILQFFKELEQAWKVSMCTRAIQLLEETRFDLQVAGLRALSYLVENENFRTTVNDALPNLFKILRGVDWHTSVACLQKLSDIYEQEPFRRAISAIFPDIIALLSDPDERVRSAVLHLSSLIDEKELIRAIQHISGDLIRDLQHPDWSIRVARLQILTELIKTGKIPTVIENAVQNILECLSFSDEDVRFGAIQALHELAKHDRFQQVINTNMPAIVKRMLDEDSRVQAALVDFLSDLAPQDTFKEAINSNFGGIVDDTLKSDQWDVRKSGLDALCGLIKSGYYVGPIKKAFCDLPTWLSDTDEDVREAALHTISVGCEKEAFLAIITEAIPKVVLMLKDPKENVQTSAIQTFSTLAKDEQGSFCDAINFAIPAIISGLDSDNSVETQIATLKTFSTLAATDALCQAVHDNALDKIILCLADQDSDDVNTQVLTTLAELATIELFHEKLRTAVPSIFPQLESDWEEVREAAVLAVSVFAKQNLFFGSTFDFDSHIMSLLSHKDPGRSLIGLQILSILRRQGGGMNPDVFDISDVVNLLKSDDMHVRLAGLRALQSLANDGRSYNEIILKPTIPDIIQCVQDPAEDVRAAALETLGNFANNAAFHDQVAMSGIESGTVQSLLASKTRHIRLSIIHTIPKLVTKVEFYPVINGAMSAMIQILTNSTDEETRVTMTDTVRSMVETGCVTSPEFLDLVRHTVPLLSDPQEDVRSSALRTLSVISEQELFRGIISDSLPELVVTGWQRNEGGIKEDEDIFRIGVLEILAALAMQEKFRKTIGTTIRDHAFTVKAEKWPTRVAILNLMSGLAAKDVLKQAVDEILPDIADALHDDENKDIRLAGVRFLSIPMVKEMFHDILNQFVPTLVDLLSDSEEEIRVAVLHTLSDLAKQDAYREAINGALPALLDALKRGDWRTRVAALATWSALAQDGTFSEIVNSATPNISACLDDYDVDVRSAALDTLSQLSNEESFRLAIINTAPHVISGLENDHWRTRVHVLKTLSRYAENDAFEDIINIFVPKILDSLKDTDNDVRSAGLDILLALIQQDTYHSALHGALQTSGISTLEHLMSDQYKHVRIQAIQLIPKVIQLDNSLDSTGMAFSSLVHVLSDDKEVCITALEGISVLITQDVPYNGSTSVISKVIQLMKPEMPDNVCEAVLRTLSAFIKRDKYIDTIIADALPAIISAFTDTEEDNCRDAAAQVFLDLASHATVPETVHTAVLPCLLSALTHEDWHICVAGLNALSDFVQQENLDTKISKDIPSILNLFKHPRDDVRIAATHMIMTISPQPEIQNDIRLVLQNLWDNVLVDLTNSEPHTRAAALDKLPKLTEFAGLLDNDQFTSVELPIITSLKDQSHDLYLLGLSTLSKLVGNDRFHKSLLRTIPKVTALLSNKRSHTRVEILQNLLKLAEHKEFRQEIKNEVGEIISVLKDREPTVRAAGLKVLLKLTQEDIIPDRIKLTTPYLLTLIQSPHTRKDAVLLLTYLAREKTLRAELLSTIIPQLQRKNPILSWGHLVLIASLFENERLEIEPSDLQFVLCLIMSKQAEVQDFILKFMTPTLQRYLETWINTPAFPPSVSSIFSSALTRSRN